MAKLSKMAQAKRKLKFKVRQYNRCPLCGRPRLPAQVPDVPPLLPQARAPGRDHRRHQVELVGEDLR